MNALAQHFSPCSPCPPAATQSPRVVKSFNADKAFFAILAAATAAVPVLMMLLLAVLVYGAWPAIHEYGLPFLWSGRWNYDEDVYGAGPFLAGTFISAVLALALAAPVGVMVAALLNEVLPGRLRAAFRFAIETLATIPSVVYGLWGVSVLAPWVETSLRPILAGTLGHLPAVGIIFSGEGQQRNLLSAVLILAVMVLPMIVAVNLDAMRAVPVATREAAMGLGATRWETIRLAVLPAARGGIMGGCILALGRALGETMAVTMVIGNSRILGTSLFDPANTIASIIATQFAESPSDLLTAALIEMALILFLVTLAVNLVARRVIRRLTPAAGRSA